MIKINVKEEMRTICPAFVGVYIQAKVENSSDNEGLYREMNTLIEHLRASTDIEKVKQQASIAATRQVYKLCGKDPSRYRPAAEALIRRVLQGKDLYKVGTLVDLINVASMVSGYSIGGFDADKIQGNLITLGIGNQGEEYEGIGRGAINIAGLPVYRDSIGGIGTPTSDHERTKIDIKTKNLLIIINGYDGDIEHVLGTAYNIIRLLSTYAQGKNIIVDIFK